MKPQITVSFQEYESLVFLAREGARLKGFMEGAKTDPRLHVLLERANVYTGQDANEARRLEEFLKSIEQKNGITRHYLAVRWQEMDQPLPPRTAGAATRFPENWPPNLTGALELLSRPICRADVDAYLKQSASAPTNVMVTTDPGLILGWTSVDAYFT
jgi:hypothetical protein